MTSQPEPDQIWPDSPASDDGPGSSDDQVLARQPGSRRSARRLAACAALLAAGVAGLAVSVLGIAHNLLPRQFTVAQRRQVATWELERRWRALPAGTIFPDSVSYTVPGSLFDSATNLTLRARLLTISSDTACAAAATGTAEQLLRQHGCTAAMRATYVDASGSLVATVAVAVLPTIAAQHVVIQALTGSLVISPSVVQALAVADSPAAGFEDPQRQVTSAVGAGPYVILSTAGFADGRRHVRLAGDPYLNAEITGLTTGLVSAAEQALDKPLPPIVCPAAPGC